MITNKRIEKCQDIKTLAEWKATKKMTILRSEDFIAQCELRMEQVRFEKSNQVTMEELTGQAKPNARKKKTVRSNRGTESNDAVRT